MNKKHLALILLSLSLSLTACSTETQADPPQSTEENVTQPADTEDQDEPTDSENTAETLNDDSTSEEITSEDTLSNETELALNIKASSDNVVFANDTPEGSVGVNEHFYIDLAGHIAEDQLTLSRPEGMHSVAFTQYMDNESERTIIELVANKKGEFFIEVLGENDNIIHFQIFALNHSNTEGNIFEVAGTISSIENESIKVTAADKVYWFYAPESEATKNLKTGDDVIVGAEVGEASYRLAFIQPKVMKNTEDGLQIIQHVVTVESVNEESIDVLLNDALLSIYHMDLVTSEEMVGAHVYIEYAIDIVNEANELLHIELIK